LYFVQSCLTVHRLNDKKVVFVRFRAPLQSFTNKTVEKQHFILKAIVKNLNFLF
jgi:hypothetical protein